MKPFFYILMGILLSGNCLIAQKSQTFTLDQAIQYAVENQATVKNAALDVDMAHAKVGEIRALGLPHIDANAQFAHSPQLRRMFFEYSPATAGFLSAFQVTGTNGEIIGVPNIFQLKSSGDVGLTITQLIFDGSYLVGLKTTKTYNELTEKNLLNSKIQTAESVTKAYYLVLINKERTTLLDANIQRLDSLLRQTRAMLGQGFVEQVDVDRLEVNYNNLLTERTKFINLLSVSEMLLKFQMGYPVQDSISLSGDIASLTLDTSNLKSSVNYNDRIEYSLLLTNKRLQELNVKNNKAAYMPRLAAFGNAGYYGANVKYYKLFGNSPYYAYTMYGLNLSVPVFDSFGRHYKVRQARIELQKAENNILNFENAINFQVSQSKISFGNQIKTLEAQKRNLQLAQEVQRVAKIKYQEGVGSNLELTTAETDYRIAQTNYYNALYDAIVAKIDYDKAMGTLYK
jgi:outer membrane protein